MDNRDYDDEDTFDKQWVSELFFSIVCLPSSEIMLEGNPKLLFPETHFVLSLLRMWSTMSAASASLDPPGAAFLGISHQNTRFSGMLRSFLWLIPPRLI